jgi:hypothetical protein
MARLTILRADDGQLLPLDPIRWYQEPTALEQRLLATMAGPVLDVGCGPGRRSGARRRRPGPGSGCFGPATVGV